MTDEQKATGRVRLQNSMGEMMWIEFLRKNFRWRARRWGWSEQQIEQAIRETEAR